MATEAVAVTSSAISALGSSSSAILAANPAAAAAVAAARFAAKMANEEEPRAEMADYVGLGAEQLKILNTIFTPRPNK